MKILVVDDEKLLVKGIKFNLENDGYEVVTGCDGMEAVELAASETPDLIVLDLMMPRLDGLEACTKIREFSQVPIIMLTAKGEDMDKILGLEYGADDYITKPFAIEELLARIRVALKKHARTEDAPTHKLEVLGVCLDEDRHEVTVQGENVELTNREFELLHTLMRNKNIVLTREKLLNEVCGYDYVGETNIIDVYVRYLRTKIDDHFGIKLIQTVRGVGYCIKES